ncbi:VOC family protein [Pukyongiella litopenaei]|uniref:VOC family protein n=1 Tax=Pukyongiella litopenaei TaxID=2605946 RepID=A0A2S0MSV7_9RHOB|nr:VOC family protein [Pukyongiella litopenaei]AVO38952.1 VOC family protein [Pukyongiella litopenaei]
MPDDPPPDTCPDRGFRPRALGEIAIRCADRAGMAAFYRDVIGLEPLDGFHNPAITFLRIGAGYGGHTAVLALFSAEPGAAAPATGAGSSLHHIALSLPFAEQEAAMRWFDRLGQPYRVEQFGWIGWRGVFTLDPEGNTVELVAYDASMLDAPGSAPRRNTGRPGSDRSG